MIMSYSFNFQIRPDDAPLLAQVVESAAAQASRDAHFHQIAQNTGDEFIAMMRASVASAVVMIEALGDTWAEIDVRFSGHVNPGFVHLDGWAKPMASVLINVLKYAE